MKRFLAVVLVAIMMFSVCIAALGESQGTFDSTQLSMLDDMNAKKWCQNEQYRGLFTLLALYDYSDNIDETITDSIPLLSNTSYVFRDGLQVGAAYQQDDSSWLLLIYFPTSHIVAYMEITESASKAVFESYFLSDIADEYYENDVSDLYDVVENLLEVVSE